MLDYSSIQYERTYRFSASHFNLRSTYESVWGMRAAGIQNPPSGLIAVDVGVLEKCFLDIHGHNFKATVNFEGEVLSKDGWLIDDVSVEKVIMEWSGINLSMHPDFIATRERATTENMAKKLLQKLRARWPLAKRVIIWETDDIFAVAEGELI